jgi:hypothetical protein
MISACALASASAAVRPFFWAASQHSPHVHLGSLDERLTEALVQAGAALRIESGDVPLWIAHDDEGSAPFRRDVMPCRPMSDELERISASRASG